MNNDDFRFDVALKMLCRSDVKESEYYFLFNQIRRMLFLFFLQIRFTLFPSNNGAEIFAKNIFKIWFKSNEILNDVKSTTGVYIKKSKK